MPRVNLLYHMFTLLDGINDRHNICIQIYCIYREQPNYASGEGTLDQTRCPTFLLMKRLPLLPKSQSRLRNSLEVAIESQYLRAFRAISNEKCDHPTLHGNRRLMF